MHRLLGIVVVMVLCSDLRAPAIAADNDPKIFALIIGIDDYVDRLKMCVSNAKQIDAAVRATFNIEPVLLLNNDATKARVEEELDKISHLPPGSYAMIYFAGHGIRPTPLDPSSRSSLFLRLFGSTPTKYVTTSLRFTHLWEPFLDTRMTNGAIFLDCCFAGNQAKDGVLNADDEFSRRNCRIFALGAASAEDNAYEDVFAKALIDTWKAAADHDDFLSPKILEKEVQDRVHAAKPNLQVPGLLFGAWIDRSTMTMLRPSAMIAFRFKHGCKAHISFQVNGNKNRVPYQWSREDPIIAVQVDRDRPTQFAVLGPENRPMMPSFTIDPRTEAKNRSFIVRELEVPPQWAVEVSAADEAEAAREIAILAETYGDSAGDFYVRAAMSSFEATGNSDRVDDLLERAAQFSPDDPQIKVALEKSASMPLIDALATSSLAPVHVASLENLGRFGAAARVGERFIQLGAPVDRDTWIVRVAGDYRRSGNIEKADTLLAATAVAQRDTLTASMRDVQSSKMFAQKWPGAPKSIFALSCSSRDPDSDRDILIRDIQESYRLHSVAVAAWNAPAFDVVPIGEETYVLTEKSDAAVGPSDMMNIYQVGNKRFLARNERTVLGFSLHKPGFIETVEGTNVQIRREGDTTFVLRPWMTSKTVLGKVSFMAPDARTLDEYLAWRPGFDVMYDAALSGVRVTKAGYLAGPQASWIKVLPSKLKNGNGSTIFVPDETTLSEYREALERTILPIPISP